MTRRALWLLIAGALVACGGGSKQAQPTTTSAASSSSRASAAPTTPSTAVPAVNPNAPDVNAAGDIPDTQVYVPFTFAAGPFTLSIPQGWARTDASGATTFTDNFNSVELRVASAASAPTTASARDNEVPAIQSSSTNFQLDNITSVDRKGGTAVLIGYRIDSTPNAVTGKVRQLAVERSEFWQNGKEAIVVLSGPVGADNVDPFKTMTDSFAWA
jgi:hypothetical protein